MKVAINKCFGGFDLSLKAQKRILELKGLPMFAYKQTKYSFSDGINLYERVDEVKEIREGIPADYIFTKDMGKSFSIFPKGDDSGYWYYGNLDRTDPDLIQTVEEMGKEASGRFGDIQIVEIPDDVLWEISDYDGIETVHEVHRNW